MVATIAPIDAATLRQKVEDTIALNTKHEQITQTVLTAIQREDGKAFSRRIETLAKKALPHLTVYYEDKYGQVYLDIWGDGIEYRDRMHIFLGYKAERYSATKARDNYAASYLGADQQNARLHTVLAQFDTIVADYNAAAENINTAIGKLDAVKYMI